MLTLLSELRLWTLKDDVVSVKPTDLGVFKYNEKKANKSLYAEGKESYALNRGLQLTPDNKTKGRVKRGLKRLDSELRHQQVVFADWRDATTATVMLSSGLLAHVCLQPGTGEIASITFDKYFVGKLVSESVQSVVISRMHVLVSYTENQVTFVYLQRPSPRRGVAPPDKIAAQDPKIFNFVIGGPAQRKIARNLSCNGSFELVAVWTKSSQMEVYPWRPTVKDLERANLHIYKVNRAKLELVCFYWTEHDPICIEFSKQNENQLRSVEQKVSRKGVVTVESCNYRLVKSRLQRISVTSIPLQTQVCCSAFSPDHEKIMLGYIDASIILFDEGRGITHLVKAAFIPSHVSWHCDSALLVVGNERCQLQCFDISLACVRNQLLSEDITPANIVDLSTYFVAQPTLQRLAFSRKPDLLAHTERYAQSDAFLLLFVQGGPLAAVRVVGGAGLKGDINKTGFTADVLINNYIGLGQVERAINILLSLNWDAYGAMCLVSLHRIANYIFKQPLSSARELQLQKALGSFHVPVRPLSQETLLEFGDQVDDITRRFFHYMMRNESYEKAFSLAIDINDADLFMDLYLVAKSSGIRDLADDCLKRANDIYRRIEDEEDGSETEHSTCSNSSCSLCTTESSSSASSDESSERPTTRKATPAVEDNSSSPSPSQPLLKPRLFHAHSADLLETRKAFVPPLSIPKPELKVSHSRSSASVKPRVVGERNRDEVDKSPPPPPKPMPRSLPSGADYVLGVVPSPPAVAATAMSIDQTLGIPVADTETPPPFSYAPRSKAYYPTPFGAEFSYKPVFPIAPIVHNHPLITDTIPPISAVRPTVAMDGGGGLLKTTPARKESALNSILSSSTANGANGGGPSAKKDGGEKNVKFSDTVTVAVVPEIYRKDKSGTHEHRLKKARDIPVKPEKELAESLPLCSPNEDYLKDFNPASESQPLEKSKSSTPSASGSSSAHIPSANPEPKKTNSTVKVVHFGVV